MLKFIVWGFLAQFCHCFPTEHKVQPQALERSDFMDDFNINGFLHNARSPDFGRSMNMADDRQSNININPPAFSIPFQPNFAFNEFSSPFGGGNSFSQFLSGLGGQQQLGDATSFAEQTEQRFNRPQAGQNNPQFKRESPTYQRTPQRQNIVKKYRSEPLERQSFVPPKMSEVEMTHDYEVPQFRSLAENPQFKGETPTYKRTPQRQNIVKKYRSQPLERQSFVPPKMSNLEITDDYEVPQYRSLQEISQRNEEFKRPQPVYVPEQPQVRPQQTPNRFRLDSWTAQEPEFYIKEVGRGVNQYKTKQLNNNVDSWSQMDSKIPIEEVKKSNIKHAPQAPQRKYNSNSWSQQKPVYQVDQKQNENFEDFSHSGMKNPFENHSQMDSKIPIEEVKKSNIKHATQTPQRKYNSNSWSQQKPVNQEDQKQNNNFEDFSHSGMKNPFEKHSSFLNDQNSFDFTFEPTKVETPKKHEISKVMPDQPSVFNPPEQTFDFNPPEQIEKIQSPFTVFKTKQNDNKENKNKDAMSTKKKKKLESSIYQGRQDYMVKAQQQAGQKQIKKDTKKKPMTIKKDKNALQHAQHQSTNKHTTKSTSKPIKYSEKGPSQKPAKFSYKYEKKNYRQPVKPAKKSERPHPVIRIKVNRETETQSKNPRQYQSEGAFTETKSKNTRQYQPERAFKETKSKKPRNYPQPEVGNFTPIQPYQYENTRPGTMEITEVQKEPIIFENDQPLITLSSALDDNNFKASNGQQTYNVKVQASFKPKRRNGRKIQKRRMPVFLPKQTIQSE